MNATREQIRQAALEADLDQQMAKMQERRRERQIAADREHRDRRERIATAAMKALLSGPPPDRITYGQLAQHAVHCADALIAELDKPKEVKP